MKKIKQQQIKTKLVIEKDSVTRELLRVAFLVVIILNVINNPGITT